MIVTSFLGLFACSSKNDPSKWSAKKTDQWFSGREWLQGWDVKPDSSINKTEFAKSYYSHTERWNKAFIFLRDNDLTQLEAKRYDLEGDSLFVMVSDYNTKNPEDANYEAHRKYIDLQYVVSGSELIDLAPVSSKDSIVSPYDDAKDIEFMTIPNGKELLATPNRFFLFFPVDAHRPGLKIGDNAPVKKIVVKILK